MNSEKIALMICHFPPPVCGNTIVTNQVYLCLKKYGIVKCLDLAPKNFTVGFPYLVVRIILCARAILGILINCRKANVCVYHVPDAGLGLVFSIIIGCFARLFAGKLYLHHHTYKYLNEPSVLSKFCFAIWGNKTGHVVLGDSMGLLLKAKYRSVINTYTIGNAVIVPIPERYKSVAFDSQPITIGHISNLSAEKGLLEVLNTFKMLSELNLSFDFKLAGPADMESAQLIREYQRILGDGFTYLGPIYDEGKVDFFSNIDYFLFPTKYAVEASPLVILEAMSYGAVVISFDKGMIAEMLTNEDLLIPSKDNYIMIAHRFIADNTALDVNGLNLKKIKNINREHFCKMQKEANSQLINFSRMIFNQKS